MPEYHYDGKLWSAGATYKTPSVGGHPLTRHTVKSLKPDKPLPTYRPSRPSWPSAGSSTVVLTGKTQSSATTSAAKRKSGSEPTASSSARAGNLPVWVAPAKQVAAKRHGAVPSAPSSVRVQLASHAQAQSAGVDGMLVGFARGDGARSSGRVAITLDYSALDKAYGGGFASRLHLVTVPGCILTTPQKTTCRVRTRLASTNNPVAKKLTATLDLPRATTSGTAGTGVHNDATAGSASMAPMTAVEAISGTSGSQGDYTATSLNASGSWSTNGTGAFTYSYPISVPRSLGGAAPSVAFSYDSQSEDGETSARNSQSSWIGDGWSYSPGFIERSYKPCKQDGISDSADLCWGGWLATLSLGGHSGTLVRDDSSNSATPTAAQTWHLQGDDGTKIEELGGADNGLWNGEYFKVTTTDGTTYYFGRNHAPGTTSDAATNSAWGEPVYSPKSTDPCYDSGQGKDSQCTMGYRFNLDFVVDPHANVQRYTYADETNYYDRGGGQVAGSGGSGTLTKYVRGGYLTEIDYGYQLADEAAGSKPGARVLFKTAQRCQTSSTFTDCSYSNLNDSTATNWPDVPYDLNCASTDTTSGTGSNVCLTTAPSFWSTDRLDSVVTQVNVGGTLTDVDSYQLTQTYSDAGGTVDPVTGQSGKDAADEGELQSVMWLSSIQHTGNDTTGGGSSSPITQPKVSFLGTEIDNRVDGGNEPSLFHPRISSITTETGESIAVTYSDPDCSRLNKTMPSAPDADTMSCYNVYWTVPGGVTPVSDWFNKTRVKTVDVSDMTGTGSPMQVSNYTYSGPAWHRDDSELTDDAYRTWDQFRGYRTVTVTTGASPDPITQKTTTYLQGMDGDVRADGSKRSVSVTDSVGDTVTDSDWLSGTPLEDDTYTQAGGSIVAKQIDLPQSFTTTATHSSGSSLPAVVARMIKTSQQRTYGLLASGSWREAETDTSYNGDALPTIIDAKGDVSVASQEKCATTSYATPPSGNPMMLSYPDEILIVAGPCSTTPGASTTISDKRMFYDGDGTVANVGTFGHLGTTGDLTATQIITGYSGTTPSYRTTQATAYDAYGRAVQVQDAAGNTTKTTFTPTTGQLPTQLVTTNPRNWTTTSVMDPLRGLTMTSTDPNGRTTTIDYDALGRRTAMWLPGRPISQSASRTFAYAVNGTVPNTVTTNTLRDDGNYSTAINIYDGMLQLRQTQSTTANNQAGRLISDTFYDSHGWVRKTNSSYYESSTSPTTTMWVADDNQVPSQQIAVHDGQGRTTTTQLWSNGTQQWQSTTAYPGVDRTDTTPAAGGTATSSFTNALGQTTATWAYDDTATPTGKASDAVVTSYTYTPAGQVATMSDNAGNKWTYSYDLLGQETKQTDPDTGTSTFDKYDDLGNLLQATDARGQILSYAYDALDRKTAEYSGAWSATPDPSKQLASFTYDTLAKGYPTSSTRYVGGTGGDAYTQAITGYTTDYQPTGASTTIPTSTGFPSNGTGSNSNTYTVKYSYTPVMGLLSEADYGADGGLPSETVGYGYDLQGLLDGFGGNGTYLDTTDYTPLGQVTDTRWGLYGEQVEPTFSYDAATGRVTQSEVNLQTSATSALDVTSYRYNQAGDVTAVSDAQSGGTTDTQCFTYDHLNRLTTAWTDTAGLTTAGVGSTGGCTTSTPAASTIGGPAPFWQSYTYNALGDRTQQVQHDTSGTTANDVTQTATYPGSGTSPATLANAATKITTTGPGGTATMTPAYNSAGDTTGRTVTTTGPLVSGLTRSGTKLCVDDSSSATTDGNKIDLWTCNGSGAQQWTIGTDGTVRVLGKCLDASGGGTTNGTKTDLYTCNGSSGQQWKAGANGSLVNTASGKCLDDPSSSTTNGTQLQIWTCNGTSAQRWTNATMGAVLPGATQSFAYDAEGRTASVTTPSGGKDQTTSYLYDAGGSLLLQTTPTSKILYLFGGAEQLTLSTGPGTVKGQRYYPGPDGITEVRSSDGTLTYEVSNAQGTATEDLAASNLAVTRRYFDPYGNPRGPQPTTWADNHGYLGKPADPTTGLDLLGARNYDPIQGRFLTADPLMEAGDPNQMSGYSYAGDNPSTGSDPTGLRLACGDGPEDIPCPTHGSVGGDDYSPTTSGGGNGGTTTSSGGTTAAPSSGSACNVASKFGCDVAEGQQMGTYGPPTSGTLRDAIAGALDEVVKLIWETSPQAQILDEAHKALSPFGISVPLDIFPRHPMAKILHAHTNTDAYKGAEASVVIATVALSDGGDAAEAAAAAENGARDAQDGLAAAADAKNVVSETTEEATATAAKPSEPDTGASGSGEGGCSFSPSTRVLLAHGKTEAIASVKPGDKVEAADPHTGKHRGPRTVQHVWINHDHDLLDVAIRTRDGHTATLHTTANHPFWDDTTHSWVPAGELHRGDALNTAGNGHVYVVTTHITPGTANRWNLTVQQLHTYYVVAGGVPILVHNTNAGCPTGYDPEFPTIKLTNYRGRFNAWLNKNGFQRLPDDWDAHHAIPQEFRDHPDFAGFDFDAPSNMRGIPGSRMNSRLANVHQEITNQWKWFGDMNPNATGAEIQDFADQIDRGYGDYYWREPKPVGGPGS
ncbi:ricin-type beta-trefoil lectin domain protein [Streptomyces sp. NPDC002076]